MVVVVEIADNLDASCITWRDVSAQHVKMTIHGLVRQQMHARFDHGFTVALCAQAGFNCSENFIIVERKLGHVMAAQITDCYWFVGHKTGPGRAKN